MFSGVQIKYIFTATAVTLQVGNSMLTILLGRRTRDGCRDERQMDGRGRDGRTREGLTDEGWMYGGRTGGWTRDGCTDKGWMDGQGMD